MGRGFNTIRSSLDFLDLWFTVFNFRKLLAIIASNVFCLVFVFFTTLFCLKDVTPQLMNSLFFFTVLCLICVISVFEFIDSSVSSVLISLLKKFFICDHILLTTSILLICNFCLLKLSICFCVLSTFSVRSCSILIIVFLNILIRHFQHLGGYPRIWFCCLSLLRFLLLLCKSPNSF